MIGRRVLWRRRTGVQTHVPTPGRRVRRPYVDGRGRQAGGWVWQRSYCEHMIRDDADLKCIRQYVSDNPAGWDEDSESPLATGYGRLSPRPNPQGDACVAPTWMVGAGKEVGWRDCRFVQICCDPADQPIARYGRCVRMATQLLRARHPR